MRVVTSQGSADSSGSCEKEAALEAGYHMRVGWAVRIVGLRGRPIGVSGPVWTGHDSWSAL